MSTRITLTDTEGAYVQSQPLGRLATVDASGAPQNIPIGAFLDEETGDIIVGGHAMGATARHGPPLPAGMIGRWPVTSHLRLRRHHR